MYSNNSIMTSYNCIHTLGILASYNLLFEVFLGPSDAPEVTMTQKPVTPSSKPDDLLSTPQSSSQETTKLTFVYVLLTVVALLLILILVAMTGLLIRKRSELNKG